MNATRFDCLYTLDAAVNCLVARRVVASFLARIRTRSIIHQAATRQRQRATRTRALFSRDLGATRLNTSRRAASGQRAGDR